jgi:hypothetical protein
MARSFKVYLGEDETPVYDLTDATSNVHVIWDEIEAGGRAFKGESTQNSIPMRDEQAETGEDSDLPVGLTYLGLPRGSRWEWLDGPDGSEVIMAAGRIGPKDYSRGRQKADRARELTMQAADRNEELRNIIVDAESRPEETDDVRVEWLRTTYLSANPRLTTNIAGTYISSANPVTMPAVTYDGTTPAEILADIASFANKNFFITVDDELWYDDWDSTVYQAGIRISDRIDEVDTESVCSPGAVPDVVGTGHLGDSGGSAEILLDIPSTDVDRALYVWVRNTSGGTITVQWQHNADEPATREDLTKIASTALAGSNEMALFRLLNPTPTSGLTSHVRVADSAAQEKFIAIHYETGVDQVTPNGTVVFNTGTGTVSTVTAAGSGTPINAACWFANDQVGMANPTAGGGQTSTFVDFDTRAPGQPDSEGGAGYGAATPTWTWSSSQDWVAGAVYVNGSETGNVATFPPIWDVGPASSEDGIELLSGLRLYYGTSGAFVHVSHAGTSEDYWHSEKSVYTSDPAITDATAATTLANSMLFRSRLEERTYNVSIGPLSREQVGCIKPGQLLQIKARAIPDADDQFVSRRIAQLKWTTPVPSQFYAHLQLSRPVKEVPNGIGPKAAVEAVTQHSTTAEQAHTASQVGVVDTDGNFTGTDVEAVLDELFDAIGGSGSDVALFDDLITGNPFIISAHRGDIGSADGYPENTLEGIRQAAIKGAPMIEIDVQRSSEGTWHCIHDTTATRTTDGTGTISAMTDAAIAALNIDGGYGYDAGRHGTSLSVPTLESVLEALRPYSVLVNFDNKDTGGDAGATALAEFAVAQGWLGRVTIHNYTLTAATAIKAVSDRFNCSTDLVVEPDPLNNSDIDEIIAVDTDWNSLSEVSVLAPLYTASFVHPDVEFGVDETTKLEDMFSYGVRFYHTLDLDTALSVRASLLGAAESTPALAFDDLTDVTAPSPVAGEMPRWNGTAWVNDSGLICVDPGAIVVDAATPFGVTLTSNWGVDVATPYYDDTGAAAGDEAALFYDPLNDRYTLIEYDF